MSDVPSARLIIVDDEPAQIRALCGTLEPEGYLCAGFTTASEALTALRTTGFDLLLTDLNMPGMDGISVLHAALAVDPDIVGIMMTGEGSITTAVSALKAGAHDYILKPFTLSVILPVLSRALGVRRLRKENADLARQMDERTQEIEAANRAKSIFLANMSHEIRTPLNAVLGYSQLMLRDPALSAGAKHTVAIINRSGEHLLALINDILDMSKIEAGKLTLTPVVFDLLDLLRDLELMFRLGAEARRLRFDVQVDAACGECIEADKGKIRQVLINLIGNAVKFTEGGSVTLRVSMNQSENGIFRLFFVVEDTGRGIAFEEQRKLFEPFAQSESGREHKGGTGLGLAISRELVRLMGGEIMLSSEPGKGSTFYFDIPVRPGTLPNITWKTERPRLIAPRDGAKVPRILVVDDEADNRGWLTGLLRTLGFEVHEAENGEAGIRLWQEWRPQLILMDMRMPVMDGIEATRRIRALAGGRETVIFALTASALNESRELVMESGVDDFLSKPCMEGELLEKTREHLGLTFLFEEETQCGAPADQVAEPDICVKLPLALTAELQHAVASGETDYLYALIRDAAKFDQGAATALRKLADDYDYDALTRLLEEVRA